MNKQIFAVGDLEYRKHVTNVLDTETNDMVPHPENVVGRTDAPQMSSTAMALT